MSTRRRIIVEESSLTFGQLKQLKGKVSLGLCCINNSLRGTNKKNEID